MPTYWELAPESVVETVERIRNEYHRERLRGARIALLVRPDAPESGGQRKVAACSLWPSNMRPFGNYDFLIWFALDEWIKMPVARRDAVADHELCHALFDRMERKASIRPHDITEFYEVWRRHGPYLPMYDHQREIVQAAFEMPGIDEDVTEAFDPARMNGDEREIDPDTGELIRRLGPTPENGLTSVTFSYKGDSVTLTGKNKRTPAAPIAAQVTQEE